MGKSAVRMVAEQYQPVAPKTGIDGIQQAPYIRSKHVVRESNKVIQLNECVAKALTGTHPGGRIAAREQLARTAKSCASGIVSKKGKKAE
ncbi:MAG: hypothetical protein QW046_04225 [Candidatus Micrarchaeaceae archaeon]